MKRATTFGVRADEKRHLWGGVVAVSLVLTGASDVWAGSFDPQGNYLPAADAVAFVDFGPGFDPAEDRFVPDDADEACVEPPGFEVVEGADAVAGSAYLHVNTLIDDDSFCQERWRVELPAAAASYVATVWVRHGVVDLQMTVVYPDALERDLVVAKMAPTGRTTSDGWVEMSSNAFPVDGANVEAVYLRAFDADTEGTDLDALEVRPAGDYVDPERSCSGVGDPVCGAGEICIHQVCRLGRLSVPPLPDDTIRSQVVDVLASQLRVFYGGRKTRTLDLPQALATLESLRSATDAWTFWDGWARAIRQLHDWHTSARSAIRGVDRQRRLNLCFIEGEADASQAQAPSDATYRDVLVSHDGGEEGTHGIAQGDRLLSVDGQHPIAWSIGLEAVDWAQFRANTDGVYSEYLERLRGNIIKYATTFTVLHCDAGTETCSGIPETYRVGELPLDRGGQVRCDNRPFYHTQDNPGPQHRVGFGFYRGLVTQSTPQEAIYSLLWDTLFGGGDPNGFVNGNIKDAYTLFKQQARGVILDHRAGNGGTLDAAETVTQLVRPPETLLAFASPTDFGKWDGPVTLSEGVSYFNVISQSPGDTMRVGSVDYDPDMPVALLIHRDGSASDFMPFAMKGASSKVRVFGPAATAGAFSTFYELAYYSGVSVQFGTGDSVSKNGRALIGQGVVPDVIVVQKQSDLLQGKDTIHEAALAWLRTELKP